MPTLVRYIPFFLAACLAPAAGAAVLKVPKDHSKIQDAVDACANGDTIVISPGIYPENVEVILKEWVTIRGKGKVVIDPPSGPGLTLKWCTAVTVQKVRLKGGYVNVVESSITTVKKCRARLGSYGIRVTGSEAIHLVKNRIEDTASSPIFVSGSTGCSIVDNRSFLPEQTAGWNVGGSMHTVEGNRIQGGIYGLQVSGAYQLVAGNRVETTGSLGLGIGTSNGSILDNVVRGSDDGIVLTQAYASIVAGNDVREVAQYGLDVVASYDIDVRKNAIRKAASAGIHAAGEDCTYRWNDVDKCGSFGFYVLGDNNHIIENYARSQQGGIDIYDTVSATGNVYINNDAVLDLN